MKTPTLADHSQHGFFSSLIDPFIYEWTGLFTGDTESIERVATTSGWLHLEISDWKGRTANTAEYITVSPSGPSPPGCTE